MTDPLLVLIDGHALAYRTFFALPPETFTTRAGEPTNATYGFVSVLLNTLRDYKPDYLAVCFDIGRTFRDDLYPAYKGTRAKMPEEQSEMLEVQIKRIYEVLEAFSIPTYALDGFEADDLLGTLAQQAEAHALQTLIVTGDRDLLQLVGPRTRVLLAGRKLTESEVYDERAVRERFGVSPAQFVDYKALLGDKSDNIPGVAGIGEKTAAQLLQQHGTLEALLADTTQITPPRARTAFEKGREMAILSQKLSRIERAAPVTLDLARCKVGAFDRARVLTLFATLEFRSIAERLPPDPAAAPAVVAAPAPVASSAPSAPSGTQQLTLFAMPAPNPPPASDAVTAWQLVTDVAALRVLVEQWRTAERLAFDVETTGTDPLTAELLGVALSDRSGAGWYVALNAADAARAELLATLAPLLGDASVPKYAHNAKFDIEVLLQSGVPVRGLAGDTMVAEWVSDPGSRTLGLKGLALTRLGIHMTHIEALIGSGKQQITMASVPLEHVAPYASADVDMTLRLVPVLEAELHAKGLWELYQTVELPLVPVLVEMERAGVRLDTAVLAALAVELQARQGELVAQIHALAGHAFNIDSTQQLSAVLFEQLHLPTQGVPKTQAGKYSTAADVLEGLLGRHPIIELLLEQRQIAKLKGTYVDALPELVNADTGRLHTDYNQCGAVTGRLSSSNPNLQNIPIRTELGRRVRRAFRAAPGNVLLSADYSQIELRILAHMAQDLDLQAAFARGEDSHATAASAIYGVPVAQVTREQRRVGKTVNFAVTYGQSAHGLAQVIGGTREAAQQIINAYFERFPAVQRFLDATKRQAATAGYVETLFGRRRYFPVLQGAPQPGQQAARARAEREAINAPIQGTSADIMKLAMIRLHRELAERGLASRLILQVHDELVLDVPQAEVVAVADLVRMVMSEAATLSVPLVVEAKIGTNWDEMTQLG